MMDWVRFYTEHLNSKQLRRATRKGAQQLQLMPWLWLFAAEADDHGRLTIDGVPAEPEDIADAIPAQVTGEDVAQCIDGLLHLDVPMLVRDTDGALRFVEWAIKAEVGQSESREQTRERKRNQRRREKEQRELAAKAAQDAAEEASDASRPESRNESDSHDMSSVTLRDMSPPVTPPAGDDDVTSRPRVRGRERSTTTPTAREADGEGIEHFHPQPGERVDVANVAHRLWLTAIANRALTERRPQHMPIYVGHGSVVSALQEWADAGVELEVAANGIIERVTRLDRDRRISTLRFFTDCVLEAMQTAVARRQAAAVQFPAGAAPAKPATFETENPAYRAFVQRMAGQGDASSLELCKARGWTITEAAA